MNERPFFKIVEEKQELIFPILFSALLHILLLLLLAHFGEYGVATDTNKPAVIEMIPIEELSEKYKLADIEKPDVEKKPDKAKLAGLYDSSVDKEMVSPTPPREKAKKAAGKKTKSILEESKTSEDGFTRTLAKEGDFGEGFARKGLAIEDYFPDYHLGSHTYLNVRKFEELGYFVRMKRVFRMTFNPYAAVQEAYHLNQINANRIEAVVALGIDDKGELEELFIIQSSGIAGYDKEILRTVKSSSPFATPPGKFLDTEKKLRINWAFVVYF